MQWLGVYLATLLPMAALDFLWLGTVGRGLYRARLGALLLARPVLLPSAAFYLLYAAGVVVFCEPRALRESSWLRAAAAGAFFGFVAYGTYDLTNLATLKGWSPLVSGLDMVWGAALTAAASCCGYAAAGRLMAAG